eukprot:3394237-Rhodomonas_salina.1
MSSAPINTGELSVSASTLTDAPTAAARCSSVLPSPSAASKRVCSLVSALSTSTGSRVSALDGNSQVMSVSTDTNA